MALFKSASKELQVISAFGNIKFVDGVYNTDKKEEINTLKAHPLVWEVSATNEIKKAKSSQNIEI